MNFIENTALIAHLKKEIDTQGAMSFARFMACALYTPGLGYYTAGAEKFGRAGDFVTAPEISPLFAQCLALQAREIFATLSSPCVLEFGAGSGAFACEFLKHVAVDTYYILEVSADLRARQEALLTQHHPEKSIVWLSALPTTPITGLIFANEVIDAMPVHCFQYADHHVQERLVTYNEQGFYFTPESASAELTAAVENLAIKSETIYFSEINLSLKAWMNSVSACLKKGCILLIDYGFERATYYHPDRHEGTLMCHYQHRAHTDPFIHIGYQDITAHVDFTALAEAADALSLDLAGYTCQSSFLLSLGIHTLETPESVPQEIAHSQTLQTLLFPHEMGELFKVIAFTRGIDQSLSGFQLQDLSYKL